MKVSGFGVNRGTEMVTDDLLSVLVLLDLSAEPKCCLVTTECRGQIIKVKLLMMNLIFVIMHTLRYWMHVDTIDSYSMCVGGASQMAPYIHTYKNLDLAAAICTHSPTTALVRSSFGVGHQNLVHGLCYKSSWRCWMGLRSGLCTPDMGGDYSYMQLVLWTGKLLLWHTRHKAELALMSDASFSKI